MKRVIISMVLAALAGAQVPPLPDLPMSPSPAQAPPPLDLKGFPLPGPKEPKSTPPPALKSVDLPVPKEVYRPAPLVPVNPNGGMPNYPKGGVPVYSNDSAKPPPFKLIDNNPVLEGPSAKESPQFKQEAPLFKQEGPKLKSEGPILNSEGPFLKPPPASAVIEALPTGSVTTPCLSLTRTAPPIIKAGQPFAYEMVVRNVGNMLAPQARLEDDLPAGTRFLSSQPMAVTQGDRLSWTVDNLPPGAERRFRVEVETTSGGEWQARATLTTSITTGSQTTVQGAPVQALSMTGPTSVPVGHMAVFQIRVANTTSATLNNPMLRVILPPGLQHIQGQAIEAPLGDLAPGQQRDIALECIALQVGKLTAEATLLCNPNTVASMRATVVATEQPILMLRQTGELAPMTGKEVDFKLEVTNRGGGEVRDLQLQDELPEGLVFTGGDTGAQYDQAARTVRWNLGTLSPGQTRQVMFRAQVRGTGPQINKLSARAAGVAEAQLQTILRMGGGTKR